MKITIEASSIEELASAVSKINGEQLVRNKNSYYVVNLPLSDYIKRVLTLNEIRTLEDLEKASDGNLLFKLEGIGIPSIKEIDGFLAAYRFFSQ